VPPGTQGIPIHGDEGAGAQAIEERGHSQLDEPPHTDLSLGSDFSLMQMLYPQFSRQVKAEG